MCDGGRFKEWACRPQGGYRRQRARALVKEVIDVDIDELLAHEHAHERAEREERTERDSRLAALARALARDDHAAPTSDAADSATRIAGATAAPSSRPITPASLTSPMPMPPG